MMMVVGVLYFWPDGCCFDIVDYKVETGVYRIENTSKDLLAVGLLNGSCSHHASPLTTLIYLRSLSIIPGC